MNRRTAIPSIVTGIAAIMAFPAKLFATSRRFNPAKLPRNKPVLLFGYDLEARTQLAKQLCERGIHCETAWCDPRSDVKLTPAVLAAPQSAWLLKYTRVFVDRRGGKIHANGLEV